MINPLDFRHQPFQRVGGKRSHLIGRRPVIGKENIDHRHGNLRVFLTRCQDQAHDAKCQTGKQQQRRERRIDEHTGKAAGQPQFGLLHVISTGLRLDILIRSYGLTPPCRASSSGWCRSVAGSRPYFYCCACYSPEIRLAGGFRITCSPPFRPETTEIRPSGKGYPTRTSRSDGLPSSSTKTDGRLPRQIRASFGMA